MNNQKKIAAILVILLVIAIGGGLAAWLLPLGKFQSIVTRFSTMAFVCAVAFGAGLLKGRR